MILINFIPGELIIVNMQDIFNEIVRYISIENIINMGKILEISEYTWKYLIERDFENEQKKLLNRDYWSVSTYKDLYIELYKNSKRRRYIIKDTDRYNGSPYSGTTLDYVTLEYLDYCIENNVRDSMCDNKDKSLKKFMNKSFRIGCSGYVGTQYLNVPVKYTDEFENMLYKSDTIIDLIHTILDFISGATFIYGFSGNIYKIPINVERLVYIRDKINILKIDTSLLEKYKINDDITREILPPNNLLSFLIDEVLWVYIKRDYGDIDRVDIMKYLYKNRDIFMVQYIEYIPENKSIFSKILDYFR